MASVEEFVSFLKVYNTRTNVYSPKAYDRLAFHVRDSIALGQLVSAFGNRVVDIGSGSGLPAIVMAIVYPKLHVWAVESALRKADFLRTAVAALRLPNIRVVQEDIRSFLRRQPEFALFTAKAFAPLPAILGIVKNRVDAKNGGLFVPISARQWDVYRHEPHIWGCEMEEGDESFSYACYTKRAANNLPMAFHVKP